MVFPRQERIAILVEAFGEAGCRVTPGYDATARPLLLEIHHGRPHLYRIFSWGITHGGATRDPDEFRVQTTRSGAQPLLKEGQPTLLLGYDEHRDVFAAWDVRMHPNPGTSSSLQVSGTLLNMAAQDGIASYARDTTTGTEMVVAFKPAAIGTYLDLLPHLPGPEASATETRASAQAGSDQEVPIEELPDNIQRREAIRQIRVRVRDQRFRSLVLRAYQGRCALCGINAGLVHAAHIEGVAENGPDLITNGFSACPTHHAAFDQGLLTVDDDFRILVNERRLRTRGAGDDEVEAFRNGLREYLAVPERADLRPAIERFAAHRQQWQ